LQFAKCHHLFCFSCKLRGHFDKKCPLLDPNSPGTNLEKKQRTRELFEKYADLGANTVKRWGFILKVKYAISQ
jgi:hypothetical protein